VWANSHARVDRDARRASAPHTATLGRERARVDLRTRANALERAARRATRGRVERREDAARGIAGRRRRRWTRREGRRRRRRR
jgi:hypothetical protein